MRLPSSLVAGGVIVTLLSGTPLRAEDTRKKWQFGAGFSYWSTDDNIRSNATTAFAPVDATQAQNLPSIRFSDPRPDANELNEPTIQDNFKFDFQSSFGISRWVALQLDMSYFRGDVGNIEFYSEDKTVPVSFFATPPNTAPGANQPPNPLDPSQSICAPTESGVPPPPGTLPCFTMSPQAASSVRRNAFLPVGQITEIPVTISGLVRFRPESPFDPYVGAGVGYIFTSLDTSTSRIGTPLVLTSSNSAGSNQVFRLDGFDEVRDFTNGLIVEAIQSGARGILTYPCHQTFNPNGCIADPTRPAGGTPLTALSASVDDGMEYHLTGGVDYYFSDRWSIYIDARYVWAQSKVKVRINNEEQVLTNYKDYGCVNGAATCRTVSGETDISNSLILNPTVDDSNDIILIQGGDIRLGGFSIGVGAKVTF
jgi:outer membrane protein W